MAINGGAQKATNRRGRALLNNGLQQDDPIPARLIEAAEKLQFAYDLHLAARGGSARSWRRMPGSRVASLKRIQLQLRLSRESARAAKARQ